MSQFQATAAARSGDAMNGWTLVPDEASSRCPDADQRI